MGYDWRHCNGGSIGSTKDGRLPRLGLRRVARSFGAGPRYRAMGTPLSDRLLSIDQVRKIVPLAPSTLYAQVAMGNFPEVQIDRATCSKEKPAPVCAYARATASWPGQRKPASHHLAVQLACKWPPA